MKKPLMFVPPAQAEALFDAALMNAPRGRTFPPLSVVTPPCLRWELQEWSEDDSPPERAEAGPDAPRLRKYTGLTATPRN